MTRKTRPSDDAPASDPARSLRRATWAVRLVAATLVTASAALQVAREVRLTRAERGEVDAPLGAANARRGRVGDALRRAVEREFAQHGDVARRWQDAFDEALRGSPKKSARLDDEAVQRRAERDEAASDAEREDA